MRDGRTTDDMLPSGSVSEREGPFPVETATTTTAFCEEQTCLNTPFLAQQQQVSWHWQPASHFNSVSVGAGLEVCLLAGMPSKL